MNLGIAKQKEWLDLFHNAEWTNQSTDKTGLTIDCMKSPRGFNTLKASHVLDCNIEDVVMMMSDGRYRKAYDTNIAESSYLQKIAANTYAIYQMSKKMLVVSPRDFVLISHFHRHPEGHVTITVFSDDQY